MKKLKYSRSLVLAATAVLLGISAAPPAFAQSSAVYPPGTTAIGLSYGDLSAAWWQWLFAIPTGPGTDQNPQDQGSGSVNCSINQTAPVLFLTGSGSGTAVNRTCSSNISTTTSFLFPLINVECSTQDQPPFHCTDAASCRRCAESFANLIDPSSLTASVDGISLLNPPTQNFRAESPFFNFTTPSNNILGSKGGPGMSVSDGYWVMLKPLPPGKHTVTFRGSIPSFNFTQNVTYTITVSQ
ncbi:hypothetical protein [Burkholderia oklahomensis]|uniref:hypothetical protein n=1 Tax=Burkholderia oklahomensis TaxID=342113 RepID=UPI0005DA05B8|nr:hypothetical protein [Burkholderia oklahomensis]AJX30737.1 putative signal peptide protein [Burkholderia oklahomensis C6786]MBI0361338.1 hypothetical protein [Burkholderia oklahomensis]SUW55207.1 Uncharacterised protein [Burkholderia oklahomensis]